MNQTISNVFPSGSGEKPKTEEGKTDEFVFN